MKKGFTLIELLISLVLFTAATAIAIGGFVRALRAQREASSIIAAQSDAGAALEQMAREIRTGTSFCTPASACGSVCTAGSEPWNCSALEFTNVEGLPVTYAATSSYIGKDGMAITGQDAVIKYLRFIIFGTAPGGPWNPRITILLGVTPNSTDPAIRDSIIPLQTTVSARPQT